MKENEFIPVLEKVSSNNYADCKISRELHKMTRSFYLQIKRLEATGDEYTVKEIASAVAHKSAGKYILLDFIDSQIAWKKSMKKMVLQQPIVAHVPPWQNLSAQSR